jgi:hypothetical protein
MSRIFGPAQQVSFIVEDLDRAIRNWVRQGIGPWFAWDEPQTRAIIYRAHPSKVTMSVALGHSGDIQFELIQQHNDVPSVWRDLLGNGRWGFHHWATWPEDHDACYWRAVAAGYEVVQRREPASDGATYFIHPHEPGTAIELVLPTAVRLANFTRIREAALDWDGRNPRRAL